MSWTSIEKVRETAKKARRSGEQKGRAKKERKRRGEKSQRAVKKRSKPRKSWGNRKKHGRENQREKDKM